MSNNKEKIITIILAIIAVTVVVYKIFFKKTDEEKIDTETISIVTDANRFFTVSSCISKYINYLTIDDKENIYIILEDNYKKENNITKDNVLDYISDVSSGAQFEAKKMYSQRITKNITKYYIYGYIEYEQMDMISTKSDYYVIAILDEETLTFSIIPYDGELFK